MGEGISLYDEIGRQSRIEGTWESWQTYRKQLTDFITGQMEDAKPDVVIVGAGACHDMELIRLLPLTRQITLLDNDRDVLAQASQHVGDAKSLRCQSVSVDGVQEADYREFCEQLLRYLRQAGQPDIAEFDAYALSLLTGCFDRADAEWEKEKQGDMLPQADVYICVGLCSQLQTMFGYVYQVLRSYLRQMCGAHAQEDGMNRVETLLMQRNSIVIPRIHDRILDRAKRKVILGNEYRRSLQRQEIALRQAETPLLDGEAIEGAYQAIRDVRRRSLKQTEYTAYWPFDEKNGVGYEMILQVIEK